MSAATAQQRQERSHDRSGRTASEDDDPLARAHHGGRAAASSGSCSRSPPTGRSSSPRNLSLLARQMSVTSILAIGMVLVIVAGQIDLSVGALAGLLGAVAAMAYTNRDWPLPLAFAGRARRGRLPGLRAGQPGGVARDPAVHRHPRRHAGVPGRAARRHRRRLDVSRPRVPLRRPGVRAGERRVAARPASARSHSAPVPGGRRGCSGSCRRCSPSSASRSSR